MLHTTTETHIYQIRLTETLVSQLEFQKAKEADVAWINAEDTRNNAEIVVRNKQIDTTDENDMKFDDPDDKHILTLEPLNPDGIAPTMPLFINELKLSDFKQVQFKNSITSEFSGGILWCCNGTLTLRRIDTGKVTIKGCLSENYYKIRELLYVHTICDSINKIKYIFHLS